MSRIRLEVEMGDGDEEQLELEGDRHVFGRADDCTVRLRTDRVSRHHFLLLHVGEQWLARDLDSANGTYLNKDKIAAGEVRPGDVIRLGKQGPKLRVVRLDPPPAERPAEAKRFLKLSESD